MWDRPYGLSTFLRMLVQGVLIVHLFIDDTFFLIWLAIIMLGVSMVLDPRDRPLDEQEPPVPPEDRSSEKQL